MGFGTEAGEEQRGAELLLVKFLQTLGYTVKSVQWNLNGNSKRVSASIHIYKFLVPKAEEK